MKPYYQDAAVTLYHGDCRDVLPHMPTADMLCTDPPYGLDGVAVMRRNCTAIEDWGAVVHNQHVGHEWRQLAMGRLTDGAYIAEFFGGFDHMAEVVAETKNAGGTPWRLFYLVKTAPPPTPRRTLQSGVEIALLSHKGKRLWHGGQHTDRWIGLTPNRLGVAEHPTEKPIGAMLQIVRAMSVAGGMVLDPFAGSGTTLRAAKDLGRRAIGIEIEERYCEIAAKRLAQEVLPLSGVAS